MWAISGRQPSARLSGTPPMDAKREGIGQSRRVALGASACLAACAVMLTSGLAAAQETNPSGQRPPAKPGFFDSVGEWFEKQAAGIKSTFSEASKKVENFSHEAGVAAKTTADSAKDAADAVARIPNSRVVSGHEECITAPNGAPDCIVAANALCKGRGFESGKSLDMTTAENCPAKVWMSGRKAEGECTTITFVSRALCQ